MGTLKCDVFGNLFKEDDRKSSVSTGATNSPTVSVVAIVKVAIGQRITILSIVGHAKTAHLKETPK
jgi:hypothetical protein